MQKNTAGAGDLLHDEALAAEQTGADLSLEEDGHTYALCGAQKSLFLADDALTGGQLPGDNGAGEGRGERDFRRAFCSVMAHEKAFAGKHTANALSDAAGRLCLGFNCTLGPGASADLADHGLAGLQIDHSNGQRTAFDFITHGKYPLFL